MDRISAKRRALLMAMPLEFDVHKKSPWIAHLLWAFAGFLGAHRFYARARGAWWFVLDTIVSIVIAIGLLIHFGSTPVALSLAGHVVVLPAFTIPLIASAFVWIVDGLSVGSMVSDYNEELQDCLAVGIHPDELNSPIATNVAEPDIGDENDIPRAEEAFRPAVEQVPTPSAKLGGMSAHDRI